MKKFFQDFKKFIAKGNIFDMAVGLIIATAFNKIVSSLVNDIIMPLFIFFLGASSLEELQLQFHWNGRMLTWKYGLFLQAISNFLIIALSLFLMVKIINNSRNKLQKFHCKLKNISRKELKLQKKAIKLQAKRENRPFKEVWTAYEEKQAIALAQKIEEKKIEKVTEEVTQELNTTSTTMQTQIELLIEIRDLLKKEKAEQLSSKKEEKLSDK